MVTEDLTVTLDGKPLKLEKGDDKEESSQAQIQALMPIGAMMQFLSDGEINKFTFKSFDDELKNGIDELLGNSRITKLRGTSQN